MRWIFLLACATAAAALPWPATGRAVAAPEFSIEQHCASLARTAREPAAIEAGCRRGEERARAALAALAPIAPDQAAWCAEVAAAGRGASGSYQIYLGCIEAAPR